VRIPQLKYSPAVTVAHTGPVEATLAEGKVEARIGVHAATAIETVTVKAKAANANR
jgi:hypothetical protein